MFEGDRSGPQDRIDAIAHAIAKIRGIAEGPTLDRRAVLQLGYNLGRLSELTGLGREPFWDRWKDPVEALDRAALKQLADRLASELFPRAGPPSPDAEDRNDDGRPSPPEWIAP